MCRTIGILAILTLLAFGCGPDVNLPDYRESACPAEGGEPTTLSGIYEVHFYETENTCGTPENTRIDATVWLRVITQEQTEDGGFLVNIDVAGLSWYFVKVTSEGVVDVTETSPQGPSKRIAGTLTPDEVTATITLDGLFTTQSVNACHISYELQGELLLQRATGVARTSINGIYETHVIQTLNSCSSSIHHSAWQVRTWSTITVQEQREDDSYLVNMFLDLWTAHVSFGNMLVEADGTVNVVSIFSNISGALLPDQLDLSIELYSWTGEHSCAMFFTVSGNPVFEMTEIPEGFEQ